MAQRKTPRGTRCWVFGLLCLAACSDNAGTQFPSNQGAAGAGGAPQPDAGIIVITKPDAAQALDSGVTLHTCPAQPEPSCPTKVQAGSINATTTDAMAALEGVTEIGDSLTIRTVQDLGALACLERVGGKIAVDASSVRGAMTLYGLRNLKFVGDSIDIRGSTDLAIHTDCGLGRLESLGSKVLIGGGAIDANYSLTGTLDLSHLTAVTFIRINSTKLTSVTLPSDVFLTMGQFAFEGNRLLKEIRGFESITLMRKGGVVTGAYSLRITNNELLPNCRAVELQNVFVAAGFDPATMTVSGNAACAL